MLTLRRKYLVQKLWSAREICIADHISANAFGLLKEAVHNFLSSLDLTTLRLLAKVVRDRASGACLNVEHLSASVDEGRYLISQVWRWPDLKDNSELKHIEENGSGEEDGAMGDCLCVNPFHFSRINKRATEIPYQGLRGGAGKTNKAMAIQDDSGLSCGSVNTNGSPELARAACHVTTKQEQSRKPPWFTLAYWERDKRVGSMYHGCEDTINIYESRSKGHRHGLCLRDLNRTCEMNDNTKLAFRHIGEGIQVSLEAGDIWIYNKSQAPVFLNGELVQRLHNTDIPRVDKLLSGYGLKVFDCNANVSSRQSLDKTARYCAQQHCLRVSFVKGFGRGYKRQNIMSCPCWIEIFFTLPKS